MDIAASARRDSVELRTDIPADVAETLDAESLAEGITRGNPCGAEDGGRGRGR